MITPEVSDIFDRLVESSRRMTSLRRAFSDRGAELVNTYRHGPYKVVALFLVDGNHYWEIVAQAPRDERRTQDVLDEWLDDELVRQCDAWCAARAEVP